MNNEIDFYFLLKRNRFSVEKFISQFELSSLEGEFCYPQNHDCFTHCCSKLDDFISFLFNDDNSYYDLYFSSPLSGGFYIGFREKNHCIFGVPSDLFLTNDIVKLLKQFNAISGYAWAQEPPPDTILEFEQRVNREWIASYKGGELKEFEKCFSE